MGQKAVPRSIKDILVINETVDRVFYLEGLHVYATNKRLIVKRDKTTQDFDYTHISSVTHSETTPSKLLTIGIIMIVVGIVSVIAGYQIGGIGIIVGLVFLIACYFGRREQIEAVVIGLKEPQVFEGNKDDLRSLLRIMRQMRMVATAPSEPKQYHNPPMPPPAPVPQPQPLNHALVCTKCKKPISDDWRICPNCEEPLLEIARYPCTECGGEVDKGWRVCPHCANPLTPEPTEEPAPELTDEEIKQNQMILVAPTALVPPSSLSAGQMALPDLSYRWDIKTEAPRVLWRDMEKFLSENGYKHRKADELNITGTSIEEMATFRNDMVGWKDSRRRRRNDKLAVGIGLCLTIILIPLGKQLMDQSEANLRLKTRLTLEGEIHGILSAQPASGDPLVSIAEASVVMDAWVGRAKAHTNKVDPSDRDQADIELLKREFEELKSRFDEFLAQISIG
ncbi:MAG: zinc ribbon domain-containing protein [Planctomycetes bacterium]|nr:zinc ribbon domain-containing protein [Planctomycetota bacterium]